MNVDYVKIETSILDNPKVIAVGPIGFALHVAAILYCARNNTNGFLPDGKAATLLDVSGVHISTSNPCALPSHWRKESMAGNYMDLTDVADLLVDVGLWKYAEGGFQISDEHGAWWFPVEE